MQDTKDSDGGGLEEKPKAPSEDKTVELRKSCDYCVKLKRACDGKNPCSLCSRRNKPCTRSARKKSGPAKGTKYAPRRKRPMMTEWPDHAGLEPRDPGLPYHFPPGMGSRGRHMHPHYPMSIGEAAAGRGVPYLGGRSSSSFHPVPSRRLGEEVPWRDDPLASSLSRHQQHDRRTMEMGRSAGPLSSSQAPLPLPMGWYAPGLHDEAEPGGGGGYGMAPRHRMEPPMGYAPSAAEALARRQQQQQHRTQPAHPRDAWSVSPLEAETAVSERSAVAAMRDSQGRSWDPPQPGWPGHGDHALRSSRGGMDLAYGARARVSPATLPSRPQMLPPGADTYAPGAPPAAAREAAGHPDQRLRMDAEASLPSLPPPREPADPTAGFYSAANRASWRRAPEMGSWEPSRAGGGDDSRAPQHYEQHPGYYDPSERPPPRSAWNSHGGGSGGYSGGGGGRYDYGDYRGERGGQERRGGESVVDWQLPSHGGGGGGGADGYRDPYDFPPPPHGYERRLTPLERPQVDEREKRYIEQPGGQVLVGAPHPAERADRGRYQAYGGPDGHPYKRSIDRLVWSDAGGGSGGDHVDFQQQRGRQGSALSRADWERGGREGLQAMHSSPHETPRETAAGEGGGRGGGRGSPRWELEHRGEGFAAQETRRRGDENSTAAPPSSPDYDRQTRRSPQQEQGDEGRESSPRQGSGGGSGGGGGSDQSDERQRKRGREGGAGGN